MKTTLYKVTQPIAQFITYTILAGLIFLVPAVLEALIPEV